MPAHTEDLLRLRDGEPVESAERKRLLADPAALAELRRLKRVKQALTDLDELDPPDDAWPRIEMRLERRKRPDRRRSIAVAMAAGLAVAVVVYWLRPAPTVNESPPGAEASFAVNAESRSGALPDGVFDEAESSNAAAASARPSMRLASYTELLERSARLERLLGSLPEQPSVVRFETAGAIAGLEDQIAIIDWQLSVAAAQGLAPEQRQTLWRNRVEVMDALFQVRYARTQSQGF